MRFKIKNIVVVFSLLILNLNICAQNTVVDSLKRALKNAKHDTTIIRLRNEIGEQEMIFRVSYWDSIVNDAEKYLTNSNTKSDQVKFAYRKYQASAINIIGYLAQNSGNNSLALDYYHKSLKIQEEIKNKIGIANSLNNIGYVYSSEGDNYKAIEYWQKSVAIYKEINYEFGLSNTLNNIAGIYNYQGDVLKALDFYHRSLKIQERIMDQTGQALTFDNIGAIYSQQNDYKNALYYFEKSLKIQEKVKDKIGIAISLNNIGAVYKKQNDIAKALQYYNRCLMIYEEIDRKAGILMVLANIGGLYSKQNEFATALQYFEKSLKISEAINDKIGASVALVSAADALLNIGKIEKAKEYALKCLRLSKELGYPEDVKSASAVLKKIYFKQNNFKEAFVMYELYVQMSDSINNAETKKASLKKQFQYEYEKQAAADSVRHAEEQIVKDAQLEAQSASLKQEAAQRYALYGGLLLVIAFSVFVFNRFRVTQKQKKIIEEQKVLVDHAYESLHEKNKEVMDSIYYARRIQRALLTSEAYIERNLNELNK